MKGFVSDFVSKKGIWVAAALFISRILAFLLTVITARILTKDDFGVVTFALNYLTIFISFIGFGSSQGVLKYGSVITNDEERRDLYKYAFSYGLLYNFLLNTIMLVICCILYWNDTSKIFMIMIFSIRLLGVFLVEQKKSEFRANMDNKSFAKLDIFLSISSFILGVVLAFFWGVNGFIISLCISPFLLFFWTRNFRFSLNPFSTKEFTTKEFWRFSSVTALTTQIGELVFILDIFFVGLLMTNEDVAHYKVSSMIPMNILVLGFIFMQTEYPKLCRYHNDKKYQYKFIFNYLLLFSLLAGVIIAIGYFFDEEILSIFGEQYTDVNIYRILLFGAAISLVLRVLFVYMLAAIGKQKWNLIISATMLALTSISLYYFIPTYGLQAVSYITLACLILTSILPAIAYFYESKNI